VIFVGVAIVAILAIGYLYNLRLNGEIRNLNREISEIKRDTRLSEKKIAVVDSTLKLKKKLESQVESVEKLIVRSAFGVRLLDTISSSIPGDVRIISISESEIDNGVIQITIEAQSFRNEAVNFFMDSLELSEAFSEVSISYLSLTKVDNEDGFEFGLLMETNQSMSFKKSS
jgi:Tfp pilus assembly protein PilN